VLGTGVRIYPLPDPTELLDCQAAVLVLLGLSNIGEYSRMSVGHSFYSIIRKKLEMAVHFYL
jgi:hypothetical protein